MNKIVRSVCDTARDRQELNKGGIPVKNASYWKRQCDQLRAENKELRKALQTLVDNGGIGPESMFHAARAALANNRKWEVDDERLNLGRC